MRILIAGGRVIDPASAVDEVVDLLIEDGRIVRIGKDVRGAEPPEASKGKRSKAAKNAESASTWIG
jgi:dihydroorotase